MASDITLKPIETQDLQYFWQISYGPSADLKWMGLNGPYFQDPVLNWEEFYQRFYPANVNNPMVKLIIYNGEIVGLVSAYWDDGKLKQWLEVGIVIYDSSKWGLGIGAVALKQWLNEMFALFDYLPHIGFTTWSGNIGMQKLGDKVGMTKEGVIRKVRYWHNQYYDSVKYGILINEL